MSRKKGNIIGLDLGKSVAKFVEYSPTENQVKTIAILFIELSEWNDERGLAEKIKKWVLKYKMSKKKVEVISAVSGEHAIIKPIEIPESESHPDDFVKWEMEEYINAPLSEYSMDYQSIENDKQTQSFLAVAFRKSEIQKLMRIIDSPELSLSVVDIDLFAVQNAFESNYPELLSKNTFIIKADLHNICLIYTKNSHFKQFESITVTPDLVAVEEDGRTEMLTDLVNKIKTNLGSEFSDSGAKVIPDTILYCGDLAVDFDFVKLLESAFEQEIEKLNPFKEIHFPHKVEYADKVLGSAPQCAAALGLALRFAGDIK